MEVKVLREAGYEVALLGMGLSYGVTDTIRLENIANKLAPKDGGHNKFLESMVVWVAINAPRYWWAEADTYRVGTTKQSESTIHTICRTFLSQENFEYNIFPDTITNLNITIKKYNDEEDVEKKKHYFKIIKNNLPEGYIQGRVVCTNYKVIKNMCEQRKNHKLEEWSFFIKEMQKQLLHSKFIFNSNLTNEN